MSSGYWGYLGQFLTPSLKNKKIYSEKVSYIFPKKIFLHFGMTADQAVDQFPTPSQKNKKIKKWHKNPALKKFLIFFEKLYPEILG